MSHPTTSCAIFCRVIDNFGDAGVCWRLARQLAGEYRWRVTLYIDDTQRLAGLIGPDDSSMVAIRPWAESSLESAIPDVVIESFACAPPASYIQFMARQTPPPIWINLEYLSAEKWVDECHQLASPHPSSHLIKHFFFPGLSQRTGGVLLERNYADRQSGFDAATFSREWRIPLRNEELRLSYFAYAGAPLEALKARLSVSDIPVRLITPGDESELTILGNLTLQSIPFLPQSSYDELLWYCDINFVRGEDSFVRAQLAGKPFIWNIYPQDDDAHRVKLDAFLGRYLAVDTGQGEAPVAPVLTETIRDSWTRWNAGHMFDWEVYANQLPALRKLAEIWRNHLFRQTDLAQKLTQFCDELRDRIE